MPENLIALELRDDDELAVLSRRSRGDVAKASLAVLVQRDSGAASELARELVVGHADDRVRAVAAVTLGRRDAPGATDALVGALNDPNPTVLRRVAQSLARVGDASVLPALARVQPPVDTPAGRDVHAARMILGYRFGVPEVLVTPPPATTVFGSRRGEDITFGGRGRIAKSAVVDAVQRELPALQVDADSLRLFTCSGQRGALAVDAGLRGTVPEEGLARPRLLGALLRDRVCSERYSLDCYLLSDDRDGTSGERPRLWLVRPSGRVVHVGGLDVGDGQVRFAVTESVAPYASPVKVTGTYDVGTGRLSMDATLVGKPATRAARAAVPLARSAVMS
jgi:hypothetical protein